MEKQEKPSKTKKVEVKSLLSGKLIVILQHPFRRSRGPRDNSVNAKGHLRHRDMGLVASYSKRYDDNADW